MGKILIWGGFAAIVGIIWLAITIILKLRVRSHERKARELLENGDWQGAAGHYKAAIISHLGSTESVGGLVMSLLQLYKANGIQANLSKVLDAPDLLKGIWATDVADAEKDRLTDELEAQMKEVLDQYPGEIPKL